MVGVAPEGASAKAGIATGDSIVKVNGTEITNVSDLMTALAGYQPGQKATASVTGTDETTRTATVTLEQLPGS